MAIVRISPEEDRKRAAWSEVHAWQDNSASDRLPTESRLHEIAKKHGCIWSCGRFFCGVVSGVHTAKAKEQPNENH